MGVLIGAAVGLPFVAVWMCSRICFCLCFVHEFFGVVQNADGELGMGLNAATTGYQRDVQHVACRLALMQEDAQTLKRAIRLCSKHGPTGVRGAANIKTTCEGKALVPYTVKTCQVAMHDRFEARAAIATAIEIILGGNGGN